jgi:hypothetical protein
MKLYASDNTDLMEIRRIYADGRNLILDGRIMGSLPIKAVVKPSELRRAITLMSPRTMLALALMLFRGTR